MQLSLLPAFLTLATSNLGTGKSAHESKLTFLQLRGSRMNATQRTPCLDGE